MSLRQLSLAAVTSFFVATACGPDSDAPPLPLVPGTNPPPPAEQGLTCEGGETVAPTFSLDTFVATGRVVGPLADWTGRQELEIRDEYTRGVHFVSVADDGTFEIELPNSRFSIKASTRFAQYSDGTGEGRVFASNLTRDDFGDALVLDLGLAEQRVALTFGGAPVPDGGRGNLRFESLTYGDVVVTAVPSGGNAEVVTSLPAGDSFRVSWSRPFRGNPADFGHHFDGPIPFGEVELGIFRGETGLAHRFDIPSATSRLDVELLLEGGTFPANAFEGPRGQLHLGALGFAELDHDSPLHFSIPVVPGHYAASVVLYAFSDGNRETTGRFFWLCGDDPGATCDFERDTEWRPSVAPFDAPPTSTFEARVFRETTNRCAVELPVGGGFLDFRNLANNRKWSARIQADGRVSTDLEHGTYEISYTASGHQALTPIGQRVLSERFDFAGQSGQEWTLPTSAATIEIRVNGENMPDDGLLDGEDGRGILYAQILDDNGEPTSRFIWVADLGETGQVFESFEIIDDTYAFWISNTVERGRFWQASEQNALPPGTHRIGTHSFADANMDDVAFDLHTVDISIALDGLELDGEHENATLVLSTASGTTLAVPAAETTTVRVYDGAFNVMLDPELNTFAPGTQPILSRATYLGEVCVAPPPNAGR